MFNWHTHYITGNRSLFILVFFTLAFVCVDYAPAIIRGLAINWLLVFILGNNMCVLLNSEHSVNQYLFIILNTELKYI